MTSLRQSAFSGGLIGSALLGRSDLQKYNTGLRTMRNAIVTRNGSFENRPGTSYISTVKSSANPVRLVKFVSTTGQGLLLEFGNFYLRFYKNGAPITVVPAAIGWNNATAYTTGNYVQYDNGTYLGTFVALVQNTNVIPSSNPSTWRRVLSGWTSSLAYAVGEVVINGADSLYYYCIAANTNQQPNVSPSSWYVLSGQILEIPTVIPQAALASMQYVQLNDLMVIASQYFTPQTLTHFSDTDWSIANFTATTGIAPPTGVTVTAGIPPAATLAAPAGVTAVGGNAGIAAHTYFVTAFAFAPSAEGPISTGALSTVGGADGANPVVVSWSAVTGAAGYAIYRTVGAASRGLVAVVGTATYTDSGSLASSGANSFGATPVKQAPVGTGTFTTYTYVVTALNATTGVEGLQSASGSVIVGGTPTTANPNVITWTPVTGASSYNIYELVNGVYGFIGSSSTASFNDINILPDTSKQPPASIPLFQTTNDYPAVVGAYQQRLLFANTINQPQTVWASSTASYATFTTTLPILDSGSVQFTIAGRSRQYVQALVDLGKLVIHTSAGEYVAYGNAFNALTPTAINLVQNGYAGSSLIVPVSIGNTDLFVQARGNIIRDLQYSIYTTTYAGKDTTLYVPQLFENNTITQLDWQQVYNSIVWVIQSSGAMLGLTYIHDQEMWAWHQHDTYNGNIEQVCVVPEGNHDTVYLAISRQIQGATQRTIERMAPREFQDLQNLTDAVFTDCSLTYDGRNTGTTTMTPSTSGGWTTTDAITLTASANTFAASDVGNAIQFQQLATGTQLQPGTSIPYPIGWVIDSVTFTIETYTNATHVVCLASKNVPTWAQVATLTWGKMVHQFTGLTQLAGQTISALGDASVVFNAFTDQVPAVVSSTGTFTTPTNYLVLTAGLPITTQIQTLPWESAGRGETLMNKKQIIVEMTAMFYNSRGGSYGMDFNHLFPWIERGLSFEAMGQPITLYTGPAKIPIQGAWGNTAQVCIQQTDPLPLGVSAITPSGFSGT